jgi:class 3 adenylate cyclase
VDGAGGAINLEGLLLLHRRSNVVCEGSALDLERHREPPQVFGAIGPALFGGDRLPCPLVNDRHEAAGERAQIVAVLAELGVAADDVPESLFEAAAMASDVVFARDDVYTLRQVAEKIGQPVADVAEGFRQLGINTDAVDEIRFSARDVEFAAFLREAISGVLTHNEGQEILHVAGTALATIAEAAIANHVQGPERRTSNVVENARLNALAAELGLTLSDQLAVAFRHHLRQASDSNRRTQHLEQRELVTLTIGFLDLVGFTVLSQELPIPDLVELVKSFERRAHELAHDCRTRIVKLIGDEVMFVAEHPADAARFVTGMTDSLTDDSVIPRGGLAFGDLVSIHGDYFGPVVNLAARLVDAAVPGEVLVDDATAAHVGTEPAGRRMLKGFDEPVRVHTLLSE